MKVDTDGIQNRIVGLEITPGNYRNIRMLDDGRIFYLRRTAGDEVGEDDEDLFGEKDKKSHLCVYSLDDRKETVLGDANNYQITFDGKKMLLKIKKDYAIIDVPKDKIETKDHEHKIEGLDMQLDRRAEWRQIYFECWRQMRDFFFSPTMDGVDWKAMRDKYAALLPFVNHRNDLTYLLGELIAELNIGHCVRRRRRTPGHATHQTRLARRGIFPRPDDTRLPDRADFAWRKLGQENAFAAHGNWRECETRRLHSGD